MANPFQNTQQVNAIIRVRRGSNNDRLNKKYDVGELVYVTDKKRLFVGDGNDPINSTTGGIVVGNKVWITNNLLSLDQIQKYDLVYRTDVGLTGFYLLTGDNFAESSNYILVGGPKFIEQAGKYTLSAATRNDLGGVKIKEGLAITQDGQISVSVDPNTLVIENGRIAVKNPYIEKPVTEQVIDIASYSNTGVVQISAETGITVDNSGVLGLNIDNRTIKLSSTIEGSKLYVDSSKLNFTSILGEGLSTNPDTGKVDVVGAVPYVTYDNGGIIKLTQTEGLSVTETGILGVNIDNQTIKLKSTEHGYQLYVDFSTSNPTTQVNVNDPTLIIPEEEYTTETGGGETGGETGVTTTEETPITVIGGTDVIAGSNVSTGTGGTGAVTAPGGTIVTTTTINNVQNVTITVPENSYIKKMGNCTNSYGSYAAITNDNRVVCWGNLWQNLFGGISSVVPASENIRIPFWKDYDGYSDPLSYKPYGGDFLDENNSNGTAYQITDLYWNKYSGMALVKLPNSTGGDVWIAGKNNKFSELSGGNPKSLISTKYNNFLLINETASAGVVLFNKDKDFGILTNSTFSLTSTITPRDIVVDRTNSPDLSAPSFYYLTDYTKIKKINYFGEQVDIIGNNNFKLLNGIEMVSGDNSKNYLYVCDSGLNQNFVKKIDLSDKTLMTIGSGASGLKDGEDSFAQFKQLKRISADPTKKNVLYVTDSNRLRRLWRQDSGKWLVTTLSLSTDVVSSVDGTLNFGGSGSGIAGFNNPYSLKVTDDGQRIYVLEAGAKKIRKINILDNTVNSFSAICTTYIDGQVKTPAKFNSPYGITKDNLGNLYIADLANNRIRKINYNISTGKYGDVVTYAGNGKTISTDSNNPLSASFNWPKDIVYCEPLSSLFVADYGGKKIRKINLNTGAVKTVAGTGAPTSGIVDGNGLSARFGGIESIEYGLKNGEHCLWVSDTNNKIREIKITNTNTSTETYTVTSIAGTGSYGNTGDGNLALSAKIAPKQLLYHNNELYFFNSSYPTIRKINFADNNVYLVAGNRLSKDSNGTNGTNCSFFGNTQSMVVSGNNLIICSNNRIKKLTNFASNDLLSKVCSNFAGNGKSGSVNSTGLNSSIYYSRGLLMDYAGDFIFTDGRNLIRKISKDGANNVTSVNGSVAGFADTGLQPLDWEPFGLDYEDESGVDKLYFSEIKNDTIGEIKDDIAIIYNKINAGALGIGVGTNKHTCGFIRANVSNDATGETVKFKRIQMVGDTESTILFAALDTTNSLWVWGNSIDGAFGTGQIKSIAPTKLWAFDKNVLDFSITASSTNISLFSVVTLDNKLYSAGDNTYAQLGRESLSATLSASSIFKICKKTDGFGNVVDVTDAKKLVRSCVSGKRNNFYITVSGELYSCGDHTKGLLGTGAATEISKNFKKVNQIEDVVDVIVGGNYDYPIAMALLKDGTLYSWGYNNSLSGQCLVYNTTDTIINEPTPCYNYETKDGVNNAIAIYTNDNPAINKAQFGFIDNKGNLYIGGYSTETDIPDFGSNIPYFRKYNMRNVSFELNLNGEEGIIHRTNGTVYKIDRFGPKKLF